MSKKSALRILLDLVVLIVFNTVFFVVGGIEHSASVWLSYGFIHFAYIMALFTPFLIKRSSSSDVFGFSLYSISSTYFFVEFIVGLVFIILKFDNIKTPLVVQIVIAGFYVIILLSHLIANESTAESVERHEEEVLYIKNAASRVKSLMGKLDNKKANKQVEKVYDLLHSSPTKTIQTVYSIEKEIANKISDLERAVSTKDNDAIVTISCELLPLIEERNRIIKLSK